MGKFRSELHTLCSQRKWGEVCSILNFILDSTAEEVDLDVDDDDDDDVGCSSAVISTVTEHVVEDNGKLANGSSSSGDGGGENKNSNSKLKNNHSKRPTKRHDNSSIAPTASTTAPSSSSNDHHPANSNDPSGSSQQQDDDDVRLSQRNSQHSREIDEFDHRRGHVPPKGPSEGGGGEAPEHSSVGSSSHNNMGDNTSSLPSHPANTAGERTTSFRRQLISREGDHFHTPLAIAVGGTGVGTGGGARGAAVVGAVGSGSVGDDGSAVGSMAPPAVIELFVRVCPEACAIPDRNGNLPLHLACRSNHQHQRRRDGTIPNVIEKRRRDNRSSTNGSPTNNGNEFENSQKESCLVIYILMTAHTDALATVNRWKQTPVHSLFESKYSGREMTNPSILVETLLGTWGGSTGHTKHNTNTNNNTNKLNKLFAAYHAKSNNPISNETRIRIQSAVRRALRARDAEGNLPLHRAAECHWVDERTLRALAAAFPASCCVPVMVPLGGLRRRHGGRISSSSRSREDDEEEVPWDANRNAVIPEVVEDDVNNNNNNNSKRGRDDDTTGLFPKTGGYYGKDLAVHLLHRRFLASPRDSNDEWSRRSGETDASVFLNEYHCGAISTLLEPLAAGATRRDNAEARSACAATGSSSHSAPDDDAGPATLLPLHIAALHGVSYEILEGLCRAHPEGATTPLDTPLHLTRRGAYAIELFEEGRAGHEVNTASDAEFLRLSVNYFRRSDLLFSYHPEAVSSKRVVYCRDEARLGRFEELIRREASPAPDNNSRVGSVLSDVAGGVWLFLCRSVAAAAAVPSKGNNGKCNYDRRLPNFGASVGRILLDLEPHSVLRLNFLRTTSVPEGIRVPPLSNGRTVMEESRYRMPSGNMAVMMGEYFFHSSVLAFLEARDALAYSSTCRKAWTRGVRLLQKISNGGNSSNNNQNNNNNGKDGKSKKKKSDTMDTHGSWKISKQSETFCSSESSSMLEERDGKVSQPWQKLELPYVPSCTHTVFVSCDIAYHAWDDDSDNRGRGNANNNNNNNNNSGEEGRGSFRSNASACDGGGLLVLSDGKKALMPHLVVASVPVKASNNNHRDPKSPSSRDDENDENGTPPQRRRTNKHPTTRVRFAFNHLRGRSYTLWYYGSERHTLTATDLTVRQLVHACDYNGHNPLHVLLCEGDNPSNLKEQLDALIRAGFGSNLPIHYALKVGVLERTLRCLIEANPTSLLDTDGERRTPLHAAFDRGRGHMPYLGVVRALLTSPGANATHLKDSSGKLPIHIAAEHGAGEALLRLLVDAYADGCYRRTDNGDLPLHLLVRSGSATRATVELLTRPIIHNPTICAYTGSSGVHLPLHIAAEYRCSYKILEGLLKSYSEAAHTQRQLLQQQPDAAANSESGGGRQQQQQQQQQKKDVPKFALEIFEEGRGADGISLEMASRTLEAMQSNDPSLNKASRSQIAMGEADFNLRSDLIFVHNPNVPKSIRPYITNYYRDEKDRIERLAAVIKREALQCISGGKQRRNSMQGGEENDDPDAAPKLSEMAQLAWCWMCTSDHYAGVISDIALSLPVDAVRFLALTENPKSEPVPDTPIKDCSTPRCALILKSRLSFLGRYVFDHKSAPLHKSESCVILRAKDIGAMESYLSIQTLLGAAEPDIDDYSHGCGSVYAITGNTIEVDRFTHFARKIGVGQSDAISQIEQLLLGSPSANNMAADNAPNLKASGVKKSVFSEFCKLHDIDDSGCRSVAIKFMRHRQGFDLERQCRDILGESGKSLNVVPVLHQFSFKKGDDGNDFTRDLFGQGPSQRAMNLVGFRFGIVMPCANGDLRDICYREGISSANLRENARQVGGTLRALHEQGITHMNLQLKNVLRFGTNKMVLSDFGSALFLKSIKGVNAIGGSSTKICPSILPPEMIAKIELSNRDCFDQLMRYWKYVHADANYLKALTPHERQAISQFVESRAELSKPSHKPQTSEAIDSRQNGGNWKEGISSLLETIKFEDLPHVLAKCASFEIFRAIWERMCQNYNLWETVIRPRVDEQKQCVYMLKTFEDRHDSPPRDASTLPYKLIPPSEKVDVWIFGIFLYELCSGGNPFHTGYQGDLRGVDSYSRLFEWDKAAAEKSVREHVQDPLAQDLLCQVLVPAEDRLPSISEVLKHPFFSPKSVEAERYLEKHEEMQLLRDNTVAVRKVTKPVTYMLDNSMEKYCKLAFATDQIAFPTCLMVLPYGLNFDESINRPVAAANPRLITCAVRLGKCLLEINKATARLSFWLMMSGRMRGAEGNEFKAQMQDWLKRARYESCASIAIEIVNGLGCGTNYAMICEEVLACDGNISKAKSYMRDPIRAARRAIKQNAGELSDLYQSTSFLYLVDEMTLLPHCASRKSQASTPYPIHLELSNMLITKVLLPFMNIVVMKALAKSQFEGLANLLGLPPSIGIPDSWRSTEPGLIHSTDNSASIEDFICLQKILRKDDLNEFMDDASAYSRTNRSLHSGMSSAHDNPSFLSISALGLANIDLSPGDPAIAAVPMAQLELLFRERDPDREFGKMRRVTSGSLRTSPGLWTNTEIIRQLKRMVEIAEVEERLRELKQDLDKTRGSAEQYSTLLLQRKALKKNVPKNVASPLAERHPEFDSSFDERPVNNNAQVMNDQSEDDKYTRSPNNNEQQPHDERDVDPAKLPGQEENLEILTRRMPPQRLSPQPPPSPKRDEDEEPGAKKKMRKSKRRFRPWFTAC